MNYKKIFLGYQSAAANPSIGFKSHQDTILNPQKNPIYHDGNSHLCVIARTGSGKGVSSAIPNLLHYEGSVVVLDVKGELGAVTSKYRREVGKVVQIRPFSELQSDAINPLDLLQICPDVETAAELLASFMADTTTSGNRTNEVFWEIQGKSLLAAVFAVVLTYEDEAKRNIRGAIDLLFSDDVVYALANLLDTKGKVLPKLAYTNIATFLQTVEVTRSGILSTTQSLLKPFCSEKVLKTLENSTLSTKEFQEGSQPLSIYVEMPPAYLKSHASYVKLLFGTLIHAITTRTQRPETPTLFILDETSSLGTFPYLSSMISLGRGMGMTCCTFWQDISQIQAHYFDWQSIVNNSTLQLFGVGSFMAAKTLQELTGVSATTILNMKPEHQLIVQDGHVQNAYKVNYLTDSIFSGKYEPNPLHHEELKGLQKKSQKKSENFL